MLRGKLQALTEVTATYNEQRDGRTDMFPPTSDPESGGFFKYVTIIIISSFLHTVLTIHTCM